MNQYRLIFNEEKLEESYKQLELKNTTDEYMVILSYYMKEYKCKRMNNNYNYIVRRFT